ncbi:MAG: Gmad2 immunoglobulin-like domain-containing protein [Patescibacteria group bacterium]
MQKLILSIVIILVVIGAGIFFVSNQKEVPLIPDSHANLIKVFSPLSDEVVTSPFTIKGQARGNWYFEASFPVKLLDANGAVLVSHYATAEGEWMTTEFVPFEVTLTFDKPTTTTGTLVLEKDNPSGEPQFDDSISIPVRFSK